MRAACDFGPLDQRTRKRLQPVLREILAAFICTNSMRAGRIRNRLHLDRSDQWVGSICMRLTGPASKPTPCRQAQPSCVYPTRPTVSLDKTLWRLRESDDLISAEQLGPDRFYLGSCKRGCYGEGESQVDFVISALRYLRRRTFMEYRMCGKKNNNLREPPKA